MISYINAPIILIGSLRISLKGRGISLLLSTCFSQETIKKMQRKENNYAVSKCFECFFFAGKYIVEMAPLLMILLQSHPLLEKENVPFCDAWRLR